MPRETKEDWPRETREDWPRETREDWPREIREKDDFAITQMIMSFSHGQGQYIQEYVREAKQMSKRIPSSKDPMFAVAVVRALHDTCGTKSTLSSVERKQNSLYWLI